MYAFISGKVVEKNPAYIILENSGIGYHIYTTLNTFSALGEQEYATLYTHLAIREDAHVLYGFGTIREKSLFLQLITVSGVGCNTACIILSSLTVDEVIEAVAKGNQRVLQSVKGIGSKTAQRIIIDLQDKMAKMGGGAEKIDFGSNTVKEEALSALMVLGFNKNAAEKAVDRLYAEMSGPTVEKLIKEALKIL